MRLVPYEACSDSLCSARRVFPVGRGVFMRAAPLRGRRLSNPNNPNKARCAAAGSGRLWKMREQEPMEAYGRTAVLAQPARQGLRRAHTTHDTRMLCL